MKTVPKKISRLKKCKETRSKFYTDLSDSENCEPIGESTVSLDQEVSDANSKLTSEENSFNASVDQQNVAQFTKSTLEQVVSDLLMQNQEFKKILNRRKHVRDSEPGPGIWLKSESDLPPKSDSLPRSFQFDDQSGAKEVTQTPRSNTVPEFEISDIEECDL